MKLDTIIERMRGIFITKEYFEAKFTPYEKLLNGFIVMVLTTVVGAVLSFVIVRAR